MSVIDRLTKKRNKKQIKVKVETSNLAISTVPLIIYPNNRYIFIVIIEKNTNFKT
ncbi:MAG TPA: hypothetical protein VEW92_06745 [Nitrososphaeraceae archaeon]|jgi:hypothetical protein|nr:hypothetical protein [Nitrososphaeraceae archaeon]